MKHRKWDSKTKFQIVMEGHKRDSNLTELCNRHQISQTQYYLWRDQFLSNGKRAFENDDKERERLVKENRKLKSVIGDLTVELKKNEYD